jgi:hypothetical protein
MIKHLDDEEMTALLVGEGSPEAQRHLAACAACAAERDRLATALSERRGELHRAAERPEDFWERQREAIAARRLETNAPARGIGASATRDGASRLADLSWGARWAIAGAVAALLLVASIALRWDRGPTPVLVAATPAPRVLQAAHAAAADDALLFAVEGAVARRSPAALAPAEALVRELGRSTSAEGGES